MTDAKLRDPLPGMPAAEPADGAASAAPKAPRGRPSSKSRPRARKAPAADAAPRGRPPGLEKRIGAQLAMLGTVVSAFDPVCGTSILVGTEQLAQALDALARENPAVKRVLSAALVGGAWAQVTTAVAAIAIPIAAHHGLLPASLGGIAGAPTPAPTPEQAAPSPAGNGIGLDILSNLPGPRPVVDGAS